MMMVMVIEKAMVVVAMVQVVCQVFITDRVGIGKVLWLQFFGIAWVKPRLFGSHDDLLSHFFAAFDLFHWKSKEKVWIK